MKQWKKWAITFFISSFCGLIPFGLSVVFTQLNFLIFIWLASHIWCMFLLQMIINANLDEKVKENVN